MSQIGEPRAGDASTGEETGKSRETESETLRFTPLRSYVSRARALAKQQRGELSRLIPAPRLQS